MAAVVQQLSRLAAALLLCGTAAAQTVALAGRMGEKALLVIDGRTQTLAVGQQAGGVKLLRWVGDAVEVERAGVRQTLPLGATPVRLGAAAAPAGGREVVLAADPGGHFVTTGAINGRPMRFMVDTGATLVALSRGDAERLGISLAGARPVMTRTANGDVPAAMVMLDRVRVGDVELTQVGAIVLPQAMPLALLGNSFLSRLQMQRSGDVMRLELK